MGGSLGFGLAFFPDVSIGQKIIASFCWILFCISCISATWALGSSRGIDWIDRMGIFIRGSGFALMAFAVMTAPVLLSVFLSVLGVLLLVFGRAVWELIVLPLDNNHPN